MHRSLMVIPICLLWIRYVCLLKIRNRKCGFLSQVCLYDCWKLVGTSYCPSEESWKGLVWAPETLTGEKAWQMRLEAESTSFSSKAGSLGRCGTAACPGESVKTSTGEVETWALSVHSRHLSTFLRLRNSTGWNQESSPWGESSDHSFLPVQLGTLRVVYLQRFISVFSCTHVSVSVFVSDPGPMLALKIVLLVCASVNEKNLRPSTQRKTNWPFTMICV